MIGYIAVEGSGVPRAESIGRVELSQALTGAPVEELVVLARKAEEVGFDQVAISDHLARPVTYGSVYPYAGRVAMPYDPAAEWPDSWTTAAAILASTTTLTVATDVLVLPLRGLLEVANAAATLIRLFGARFRMGIGLGWMREEFEVTGRDFAGRAARADEMITALRCLWSEDRVVTHVRDDGSSFACRAALPAARSIPVLIGGDSAAALRRAGRSGDGWIGMQYGFDEVEAIVRGLDRELERNGRTRAGFLIQTGVPAAPTRSTRDRLAEMGVTTLLTSAFGGRGPAPCTLSDRLDALERFGERFLSAV
jgi:alkanesulfonate monooxygenase SsuD/methylene tetrahydromethanopterin reductase-like flavin-dependent oxidoreductase (luciferase family)